MKRRREEERGGTARKEEQRQLESRREGSEEKVTSFLSHSYRGDERTDVQLQTCFTAP